MPLEEIFKFCALLNQFRGVERVLLVNGQNRLENDVEHSYQLAMLAWFIVSNRSSNLDKDLILKYALIHDFVEVYAGDTNLYTKDNAHRASKIERERLAAKRLKEELSTFPDLHELIHGYELREDDESKFIYALDKIQPILNIYLDNGRTWKREGITLEMIIESKQAKVTLSPEVKLYFDQIVTLLKERKAELF